MIQRTTAALNRTRPTTMMLLIGMFGTIAVVAIVLSALAFNQRVDDRGDQATKDALCAVWAYQIPRVGEPGPTTERGRLQVDKALEQYERLGCARR